MSKTFLYKVKVQLILVLVFFGSVCSTYSQINNIPNSDTLTDLSNISEYLDTTRQQDFEAVQQAQFNAFLAPSDNTQAIHWCRFQIAHHFDASYLTIYFWGSDLVDIHVPSHEGYYKLQTGRLAKQHINFHRYERSSVTIATESVDFSKPFFVNKHPISFWGKKNLEHPISVYFSMQKLYGKDVLTQDNKVLRYYSFLSIFFISFILLLVTFFITKDKNYRNYSLYLLALILLFIGRLPFFYNVLNELHPKLYLYLTQTMHIAAAGLYLYFVVCFVDVKGKSKRLHKLSRATINGMIIFGILALIIMVFFPYFAYRYLLVIGFEIIFTVISFYLFTRLLFKKPSLMEIIVLVGSQLLVIGNILTVVYNNNSFFIITAIAEIIVFSSAITIRNKANEQKRLETKYALEKERNEKQAMLEVSALKSSFFTNISHEFRTPLSLIKGPLEDQLHKKNQSEIEIRNLKMAQQNTARMERLVAQLLALAKLESGKLKLNVQPGTIDAFVAAQVAAFHFISAEKNITLDSELQPSNSPAWFDRDALEKILSNLLGNAIKYTPEHGKIQVTGRVVQNAYHFSINNEHAATTPIALDQVFNRFYQSSDSNNGSGIGLALTKELVELHHGTITVESPTQGTIQFNIILPILASEFSEEEKLSSELHSNANLEEVSENTFRENEKSELDAAVLLVVDDNPDIRTYLSGIFETEYKIYTAENGEIGFKKAQDLVPDLIISDIKMPVATGYTLTSNCKSTELTSHIPIILLTAKDEDSDQIKGLELGADAFISKPFSSSHLQATVASLLQTRRKLQERFSNEVILKTKEIAITSSEEQFLNKLQEVLDKHITNSDFTASQFSEKMLMSRMQLHRKLKALTGQSTSEFLRSQRLRSAAQLIRQGKISISEVGYSVGFNDPSYFTKCFKQEFGVSPTSYGKNNQ